METILHTDQIEVDPKLMMVQSMHFGSLVKVIEDWQNETLPELKQYTQAKFVMAALSMMVGNLPSNISGLDPNIICNMIIDLFSTRQIKVEGGAFICPEWEEDVSLFDRDMGDLGMFCVFSCIGFHMGFDSIEIAEMIYPYRPLVLEYAKKGYEQQDDNAKDSYQRMKDYFFTNPNNAPLFQAICNLIQE